MRRCQGGFHNLTAGAGRPPVGGQRAAGAKCSGSGAQALERAESSRPFKELWSGLPHLLPNISFQPTAFGGG